MKKEIKENWEKKWHFQYPLTRGMKSFIKKAIQQERERIIEEIEKECREHIACNKIGDTSRGEWVIGFHQGLHWVREKLKS